MLVKLPPVKYEAQAMNIQFQFSFFFTFRFFQELRMAFKMFDKNKDGYIDAKELKIVTTTLGQRLTNEEVEEFMNSADLDGDGKLNYHEFVKIMTDI